MPKVNFIPKFTFFKFKIIYGCVFCFIYNENHKKKNSLTKKKKTITQNKTANKPETGLFSCRIDRKLYAISVFLPLNVPQWLRNLLWTVEFEPVPAAKSRPFFLLFFCSIRGRNLTSSYRKWTLVPLASSMSLQIRASPRLHSCSLVLFNMTDQCTFYFSQVSGKYSNVQTFRLINLVGQPLFQNRYLCIKEFDISRFSFFLWQEGRPWSNQLFSLISSKSREKK